MCETCNVRVHSYYCVHYRGLLFCGFNHLTQWIKANVEGGA